MATVCPANGKGDVAQHGPPAVVGKADPVELDVRPQGRVRRARRVLLGRRVEDLVEALERDGRLAEVGQDLPQLANRPDQHRDVADEHHHIAGRDLAAERKPDAKQQRQPCLHRTQQGGTRPVEGKHDGQPGRLVVHVARANGKAVALVLLPAEGAHHAHAGQGLLKHRAELAVGLVGLGKQLLHPAEEPERQHELRRHEDQRNPPQPRVDARHENQRQRDHDHRPEDLDQLVGEEAANRLDILRAALDQVAGLGFGVIGVAHLLKVRVQPQAQPFGNVLARLRRPAAAQVLKCAAQQAQRKQKRRHLPDVRRQIRRAAARLEPPCQEPRQVDRRVPIALHGVRDRVHRAADEHRRQKRHRGRHRHGQHAADVLARAPAHEFVKPPEQAHRAALPGRPVILHVSLRQTPPPARGGTKSRRMRAPDG